MDNLLNRGIKNAGDVEIKKVLLIDPKNKNTQYNLIGSFVDLTIYENLFSPMLTGYIVLAETQNLLELVPIVGEELIYVELNTPTMETIKLTFVITKVGAREHQDKRNNYSLNFMSYEAYKSINTRVSKAFYGNTSQLISKVFEESFGKKMLEVEESDNSIKFISPFWSPFNIINYITNRALFPSNKMITPNYLFYETNKGHKFKSISSLFSTPSKAAYVFDKNPLRDHLQDGTSVKDINREYSTVKDLTFVSSHDVLSNITNGSYNHRLFGMNILRKNVNERLYNIGDDFDKTIHADKHSLANMTTSKTAGLYSVKHVYPNLFDNVDDISDEIQVKRIPLLQQLNTYKLNIVVHGRTDLEVGDMVFVVLNQFRTVDYTDAKSKDTYDKLYSGRYLVTAIQHRFTQAKHEMNMQLVKDSSYTEIEIK